MSTISVTQVVGGKFRITIKNGKVRIDSAVKVHDLLMTGDGMQFEITSDRIDFSFGGGTYVSTLKKNDMYTCRHVITLYGNWDIVTS